MDRTQFSIFMPNKAGELAKLARLFGKAGVNIQALAFSDATHAGIIKIVVDKAPAARQALKRAKLQFTEQKVLEVLLKDKPGSLAEAAARLAKAGLNIDYIYGSTCGCGGDCDCEDCCPCRLIFSVAEAKQAEALLAKV